METKPSVIKPWTILQMHGWAVQVVCIVTLYRRMTQTCLYGICSICFAALAYSSVLVLE